MKIALLKLTITPSFESGFSLTLMQNKGVGKGYILKYEDAGSQAPASQRNAGQHFALSEDIKITNDDAQNVLEILKQEAIPVAPQYALGLDGTVYELTVSRGVNEVCYKWWESTPQGWEPLSRISNALLRLAHKPELPS